MLHMAYILVVLGCAGLALGILLHLPVLSFVAVVLINACSLAQSLSRLAAFVLLPKGKTAKPGPAPPETARLTARRIAGGIEVSTIHLPGLMLSRGLPVELCSVRLGCLRFKWATKSEPFTIEAVNLSVAASQRQLPRVRNRSACKQAAAPACNCMWSF